MPPISGPSPQRQFRRGYVACAHCRSHKVRCVLGTEPPCAKCRREHRECVFERTKRGPRTREAPHWAEPARLVEQPTTEVANHPGVASESRRDDAPARRNSSNNTPHLEVPAQAPTSLLERTICPDNELQTSQGDGSPGSATISPPLIHPNPQTRDECCKLWHPPIVHELSQTNDETLDICSKIPFVRLGWFTAQEALTYMDMFHRHLAPFCPAFMSEVEADMSRHARIAQEPMLCTTIMMLASRFFTLPGPGGLIRSHLIHHRLWQQCERLIQLLMYGQERHLRGNHALSTIQSLLLLSEWHPRSLRSLFCAPQSNVWEGRETRSPNQGSSESRDQTLPASYEHDLLVRAKRSDRLSWMMVGLALNLAHEAGVFVDAYNDTESSEWLGPLRTRKLLYVYVTNLSVRLGFQNTFTQDIILARALLPAERFGHRGAESCDISLELWLGLVRLSRTASAMFFGTRSNKKDLLRNGDYIILLQSFTVTLSKWYDEFEASHSDVVQDVQRLLLIEYHNLKTYTHALAIQAILERAHSQNFTCSRRDRLELLSTCYLPEDFTFIHEVITNSNIILQTTISMAANGRLRFIPIRQLQCIMSAFVFLFKAIKLCTSREDVQTSLVVLEQCVKALGEADVDEMDLSRGTQEFLHSQVQTIREDANGLFSASTDHGQALGAQVMADTGEPPALDAMTASQSLLLGVNWNQDTLMMLGVPADLATSWSSLDASGRLTVADPLWQSVGFPWDASG
ncbi:C6 transcription factor [Pyrenophora tritici-repentis]|nr:C6 transcription factor [Pyrenophora tritici-repentis]